MISSHVEAQPSNAPRQVLNVDGEPIAPQTHRGGCSVAAIVITLVVIAAVAVGAYFLVTHWMGSSGKAAAGGKGAKGDIPVKVAAAKRGDMDIYLQGLGLVTPLNNVTIKSRVDGQIMKIAYTEGQIVTAGQLLIQIDPRPYQAQLEQAEGQHTKDVATLDNAKIDLQRYLSIPNSVTQQQIDLQKATVQQDTGAVQSDQSAVDNAKLNLVYCQISAPITGRIGLRLVDVGNMVHATDTSGLAVIAQIQPITVVFTVAEDQISQVFTRPDHGDGLPVQAYNRDLTQVIATGKLLAIDNQVDPATGTVKIKAQFDNADNALFPNQFVNAKLLVNTLKNVVLIPAAAVQIGPQSSYVYVVKPDKTVQLANIKVGPREGNEQVVEEGVTPGQSVVTDGVDKLIDGTKVIVTAPDKGGGAGSTTKPSRGGKGKPATSMPSTRPAAASEAEAR
jgi:multidrug efflux system membrane fusion protein